MQEEILREVGPEAFDLGLLFGTESDPAEEEQEQLFCLDHMLLLEFVSAKYLATAEKVCVQSCPGEIFTTYNKEINIKLCKNNTGGS